MAKRMAKKRKIGPDAPPDQEETTVNEPPLRARPVAPPLKLAIDPKKIDEAIKTMRDQVAKYVRRGFADKVRISYKGKPLAPDIPVAYFLAAEAFTFWSTGILRALIVNLGAKQLLEITLISSAEEHYTRGMERYLAGDIEAAIASFQRGVESDDYHAASHLMLGIVNKVRGDWTKAKRHFHVASELDPKGETGAKAREHLRMMSKRADEPASSDDSE